MALPKQLPWDRASSIWKSQIDPVLANLLVQGSLLKNISLTTGTNQVNHLLGQTQQGWMITDINGAAQIYRSQPFNDKTLTLTSDANVTVSLWVF